MLKGIDKVLGLLPVSLVDSLLGPKGWSFVPYAEIKGIKSIPGTGCKIPGHKDKKRIRELYSSADPEYKQRCKVPVIWDTKLNTIVNNESCEVICNLHKAFDDFIAEENRGISCYPEHLRQDIDAINEWVYTNINNGDYKCGFATDQDAYESGLVSLFSSLDRFEQMLQDGSTYLCADRLTEARPTLREEQAAQRPATMRPETRVSQRISDRLRFRARLLRETRISLSCVNARPPPKARMVTTPPSIVSPRRV